jgi:hypothetical protein
MIFQFAWENWEEVAARARAAPEDEAAARSLADAEESCDWIWDWASRMCHPVDRPLVDQAWRGQGAPWDCA